MDGFAVTTLANSNPALNSEQEFISLNVVETVTAGMLPSQTVTAATAVRIMTGAALPAGCDCVVPIELTKFDEAHPDVVTIPRAAFSPEANLMRQGGAAKEGHKTDDHRHSVAATADRRHSQNLAKHACQCSDNPSVAVLATGDELIPFNEPLRPGAIRNSNEPMLAAQAATCNAIPVSLGVARDNIEELSLRIQQGLQHDVLLLSGGVSAGTLDLVPQQLAAAGVEQIFHGVNMKPGKPLWFGIRRDRNHAQPLYLACQEIPSAALFALNSSSGRLSVRFRSISAEQHQGLTARLE